MFVWSDACDTINLRVFPVNICKQDGTWEMDCDKSL